MPSGPYLILINRTTLVGELLKCSIFQVNNLLFVPLKEKPEFMTIFPEQDQVYIDMFKKLEQEGAWYFSYELDLTKSMQSYIKDLVKNKQSGNTAFHQNFITNDYIPKFSFNHEL